MAKLTDAEQALVKALRTVREQLIDTIAGLDDTITEIAQAAEARPKPQCVNCGRVTDVTEEWCPVCGQSTGPRLR